MKNKSLIILILVFVLLLGGAGILYKNLSSSVETNNIQVQPTPAPTPAPTPQSSEAPVSSETEEAADEEPQQIKAPDFTAYDIDGNAVKLSGYFGKPIVLNFWASWCGPCQMEMPDFQEKFEEYGDEINFLMVNMTDGSRETVETASEFITDSGFTFPVFYDTDIMAATIYGVYSLPTTYGIDADGNAIVVANGAISAEDVQTIIDMIS